MFKVYGSFEATFSNLDIVNGNVVTDGGAAFYVSGAGQLTLVSVTLSGHNTAASGGAIIWISTANFVAMDCTFSDNEATGDGGAIHVTNAGKLVSSCSLFFANTHLFTTCLFLSRLLSTETQALVTITGTKLTRNKAGEGGAIYSEATSLVMANCNLTENEASVGGAIFESGTSLHVAGSEFTDNEATSIGGGAIRSAYSSKFLLKIVLL
jgi:predicted outer membrane repeat protein